jgi:hypothetical protein
MNKSNVQFKWKLSLFGKLKTLTVSGNGAMPEIDVPWYSKRDSISRIVFPGNLTSIGKSAFSGCTNLTSVTIPDSVTSIGEDAFKGTRVSIPDKFKQLKCSKEAMIFAHDNKARKVLDNALTYVINVGHTSNVMNVGQASNNANIVYQCSVVMSKLQHNFSEFTEGDILLSKICLLRYVQDIPTLVIVNPQYRAHFVELNNDRDYIMSNLLPKLNLTGF